MKRHDETQQPPFQAVGFFTDWTPATGDTLVYRVRTRRGIVLDIPTSDDETARYVISQLAPPKWWQATIKAEGVSDVAMDHVFKLCREAGRIHPPVDTTIVDTRELRRPVVDPHPVWVTDQTDREACNYA